MTLLLPSIDLKLLKEYPFKSRFFQRSDECVMHYVDEGQGQSVIMIHGNPTWSFLYRKLIGDLDGFRRIAFDHIGMGLSTRPKTAHGLTLKDRVEDLAVFIDSLNISEPIHLVMHDWGAPIGLGWAIKNLERVASLTIMNTALKKPDDYKMPWQLSLCKSLGSFGQWLAIRGDFFVRGALKFGAIKGLSDEVRNAYLAPYKYIDTRRAIAAFIQDIPLKPGDSSFELFNEIDDNLKVLENKPVFILWGLKDFVFKPSMLQHWEERLPNAEVLTLPSAGHFLLEDEPEICINKIREFLINNSGK